MPDAERFPLPVSATPPELACIEVIELVTDHLDGALSGADEARVERHLASCGGCTTYVQQIRQAVAAARHLVLDAVSTQLLARLIAIHRSIRGSRPDA